MKDNFNIFDFELTSDEMNEIKALDKNQRYFTMTLEEQEKIANILDHFDTLVNDLSQGLPAEIEARQKQYKYYRDQLLTFKRM